MGRRKFYIGDVVKNVNTTVRMTIEGYSTIKGAKAYKGKNGLGKTIVIPETSLVIVERGPNHK